MARGQVRAFRDNKRPTPVVWRVLHGRAPSGDNECWPANVCHVLHVDALGERGAVLTADAQRGVVGRAQLNTLGIGRGSIRHRLSVGTLTPIFPAVFAYGHSSLPDFAREVAALLYAGDDCVLSHASAARLWGLPHPATDDISLTVATRHVRPQPGLRIHRVRALDVRDVRLRLGIPCSSPARALLDLAGEGSDAEVERALNEARVLGLVSERELDGAIGRAANRPGVRTLRRVRRQEGEISLTRSEAERRFLALIETAELPRPISNARLDRYEVDFLWRAEGLVVEVDGRRFHGHEGAFDRDRKRDQVLGAAGYRVLRVSWRQLEREPVAVAVRIGQALLHPGL